VDENVLAGLALDETEALAGVKPLYCSLFFHCFSFSFFSKLFVPFPLAYNKKGREFEVAASSKQSKGFLEQQTQKQTSTTPGRVPEKYFSVERPARR
jgi:hypothetical protein